jgi:hypothetical protein
LAFESRVEYGFPFFIVFNGEGGFKHLFLHSVDHFG